MLWSPDRSVVIKTPMKCGSTSLENWLLSQQWAYVMGPHPWDPNEVEKHTNHTPYLAAFHGLSLCLIRNPYDRMRSLANHSIRYGLKRNVAEWFRDEFDSDYAKPITELYTADEFIRIEHVVEDLRKNNVFVTSEPTIDNITPRSYRLTPAQNSRVRERHAADFEAGQYSMTLPT